MASDLKSGLVMTAFQQRPHVKLMGNPAARIFPKGGVLDVAKGEQGPFGKFHLLDLGVRHKLLLPPDPRIRPTFFPPLALASCESFVKVT